LNRCGIDVFLENCSQLSHRISSALIKNNISQEQKHAEAAFFGTLKLFCSENYIQNKVMPMKPEQAKTAAKALNELNESYVDMLGAIKGTADTAEATKKLWREGNKSRLIKIGVALVVFPEPTPISETIGACFIAAGAVQKGIQNRAIYLEDITKTFKNTLKDVLETCNSMRI
jgi:hypothetical protein